MSESIISAEHLGKKYIIGHRRENRVNTLRDLISISFRHVAQKLQSRLSSNTAQLAARTEELWALRDISFKVGRGERLGIIGHNGAGKSTLLKLLSRITEPTEGLAVIDGRVSSLLEVGTGFHSELTGRENIFLNGAILGMTRREIKQKFDEIVAFADIEKFLDTPVKRYSSGMYIRLAFAVAAHLEPEILLVDEVLAVGDAAFQKKCLGKMNEVADQGRTILFVSHNMIAIQSLCPKVMWLDSGRIRELGETHQVITNYLKSSTASDQGAERNWEHSESAPGNETFRLHRVAVVPESENADEPLTTDKAIKIIIEYWNLLPDVHLHCSLQVYNEQGIVAFSSTPAHFDPLLNEAPPTGLIRTECHIPGNLLNSGYHAITLLMLRSHFTMNMRIPEVIGFEIIDASKRSFSRYAKEPGVVRPQLAWDIRLLSPLKGKDKAELS